MILKRQVILKAIVTESLKKELIERTQTAVEEVKNAADELERQSRRLMLELQRTDLQRAMAFRQQLEAEKKKHTDAREELEAQLESYQELELGEELVRGQIEGQVEISVGDNLMQRMGAAEIVIEDDLVKEIREPDGE